MRKHASRQPLYVSKGLPGDALRALRVAQFKTVPRDHVLTSSCIVVQLVLELGEHSCPLRFIVARRKSLDTIRQALAFL